MKYRMLQFYIDQNERIENCEVCAATIHIYKNEQHY